MQPNNVKVLLIVAWFLAVAFMGAAFLTSVSSWVLLAVVALIPVIVFLRLATVPATSMSEDIQRALRG